MVSPFSMRASGMPCSSRFILQIAQVPRFFFLPMQCDVHRIGAQACAGQRRHMLGALDEHAAGAAGGIADAHAFLRVEQFHQQAHHPRRGVEFTAFFTSVIGKALDQILIRPPQHIRFGEIGRA